jgi:hypothetical protein
VSAQVTNQGRTRMGRYAKRLVSLARQKPRYGYRRLHALLERREHPASVMRIYRLYRAEGLAVLFMRLEFNAASKLATVTALGIEQLSGNRSFHFAFWRVFTLWTRREVFWRTGLANSFSLLCGVAEGQTDPPMRGPDHILSLRPFRVRARHEFDDLVEIVK